MEEEQKRRFASGEFDAEDIRMLCNSKDLHLEDKVKFLGFVEDSDLPYFYNACRAFIYLSKYEGFGLPILEAFYHGTPVVTSNVGSMPEVAGNAAELVNPNSVEDIRAGIEKILNESKLKQQERLKKMIIRLHQFSWDKVARETVAVYHQAISKA